MTIEDNIRCTSTKCIYKSDCYRHNYSDDDDIEQTYCNLEERCNLEKSFDNYIKKL